MNKKTLGPVPLITTPEGGRYRWWPALQTIEFLYRGDRTASDMWPLSAPENTLDGAVIKACGVEIKTRRDKQ